MKIECNSIGGNMYLVEALDTYETLGIPDNILGRIPKAGEQFEVTEARLTVLLGANPFNKTFVKLIKEPVKEEIKEEIKEEPKPKRTIKKKKTK